MSKSQLFYVGIKSTLKGYILYVTDKPLCGSDAYLDLDNEIPLRKNHWRSAVKHYVKYNLYDFFFKKAVSRSLDVGAESGSIDQEGGLGNMGKHLKENKDKIKSDAKSQMEFMMEKDEKGDFKVERI